MYNKNYSIEWGGVNLVKKYGLLVSLLGFILSACRTHQTNIPPQEIQPIAIAALRAFSDEKPLKIITSKLDETTAKNCIHKNIVDHLGVPSHLVKEIELIDHSNIVMLYNPYSHSEGIYIRIAKTSSSNSTLELYKNNIHFVSKHWHKLLDICQ